MKCVFLGKGDILKKQNELINFKEEDVLGKKIRKKSKCGLRLFRMIISFSLCWPFSRRYMAEILPIRRKTLYNQSINQSWPFHWLIIILFVDCNMNKFKVPGRKVKKKGDRTQMNRPKEIDRRTDKRPSNAEHQ